MAKKALVLLVLAAALAGGVFAQEKASNIKKNWLSGELSLLGAGARYEYMLNKNWSVGVNAYWTSLFFVYNDLGANVVGRFYPWGKTFFAELGVGFGAHSGVETVDDTFTAGNRTYRVTGAELVTMNGVGIVPGIGWKLDVGKPGGFYMSPLLQVPITIGEKDFSSIWSGAENEFGVGVGFRAAFGMGIAF